MSRFRKALWLALGAVCLAWAGPALADPPAAAKTEPKKKPEPTKFLRVKRDKGDTPIALETAVVRYVPKSGEGGVTVDLVAAVHVGDKAYYEALNKKMAQYDVLLYELVAPEGTRIPKGGKREKGNPLSALQDLMKTVLDLESQTEQIDYQAKNFVHADLSPEKMAEAIKERGDDGLTIALSVAADLLRKQNLEEMKKQKEPAKGKKKDKEDDEPDLMGMLLDPNAAVKLKRAMAEQFEASGDDGGLGPTIGTILVADRNKAALKVLQKEIAKGKKKIGIFYGAAHMPDFEKRLAEDFDLKKDKAEWLTAWDLKARRGGVPPVLKLLEQLDKLDK
jgi:hypothetical protein